MLISQTIPEQFWLLKVEYNTTAWLAACVEYNMCCKKVFRLFLNHHVTVTVRSLIMKMPSKSHVLNQMGREGFH
jgi:hypothetical protein